MPPAAAHSQALLPSETQESWLLLPPHQGCSCWTSPTLSEWRGKPRSPELAHGNQKLICSSL